MGIYIQIGTNDGRDEFNLKVKEDNPSKIILVEPNAALNSEIRKSYNSMNVIIENVAITDKDEDSVALVIPKNKGYCSQHYSLLPMDDWGDNFEEMKVKGITFNSLCKLHNINHVDYLQIDTEGYDCSIIQSIDFKNISISIIKYEKWNFDINCFKRHGEKMNMYGVNGMNRTKKMLLEMGYSVVELEKDVIAKLNS